MPLSNSLESLAYASMLPPVFPGLEAQFPPMPMPGMPLPQCNWMNWGLAPTAEYKSLVAATAKLASEQFKALQANE